MIVGNIIVINGERPYFQGQTVKLPGKYFPIFPACFSTRPLILLQLQVILWSDTSPALRWQHDKKVNWSLGVCDTVDGSEIRRSPVEVGSFFPLFIYRVLAPSQVVGSDSFHQQWDFVGLGDKLMQQTKTLNQGLYQPCN